MKNNIWKILIVVALIAVVGIVLATKSRPAEPVAPASAAEPPQTESGQPAVPADPVESPAETVARTAGQSKSGPVTPPAANPDKSGEKAVLPAEPAPPPVIATTPAPERKLPRLLDLGAKKCVPCKMMAPLLEELAKDYKGRLDVEFIDVWENPGAAEQHGIQSIPTQIFYDADGKEFYRHVGFYAKEDILAKFKERGITF